MGHDGMVQTGKKDLSKGLAIDDEKELKRTVATNHVIDTAKRRYLGHEPKLTE